METKQRAFIPIEAFEQTLSTAQTAEIIGISSSAVVAAARNKTLPYVPGTYRNSLLGYSPKLTRYFTSLKENNA